jgi:hypothetical protein
MKQRNRLEPRLRTWSSDYYDFAQHLVRSEPCERSRKYRRYVKRKAHRMQRRLDAMLEALPAGASTQEIR